MMSQVMATSGRVRIKGGVATTPLEGSDNMRANLWIVACLGIVPVVSSCADADPKQPTREEPAGASQQALEIAMGPPVINLVHDDLAPQLAQYSGFPIPGRLTPGMIAAVVKGRHIVALGASGWAKLQGLNSIPMTEDMIFNIGSNTKSMSATLLSILIAEHPTLTWDTTLAEALPWANVVGKDYIKPDTRKLVKLRDVAAHRSGIDCSNTPEHEDYPGNWYTKTRPQLLKEYLRGPAIGENGTATGILAECQGTIGEYAYENENYSIIQAVIDTWSGMSFLDYAKLKLIDPNGMGKTWLPSQVHFLAQSGSITAGTAAQQAYWNPYFFRPDHPLLAAGKYTWAHKQPSGELQPILDPNVDPWGIAPARGGFAFDIVDWARYAMLHLRDTSPAIQALHVPYPDSTEPYAFGWNNDVAKTPNGIESRALCHSGALDDVKSQICVYPELDIAYMAVANGGPFPGTAAVNMTNWMSQQPAYALDSGGCVDDPNKVKGVQRYWDQEMFGCAGSVTFANRALLCKAGYHVCSAEEYVSKNTYGSFNAEPPKHHYWTNDNLRWGGTGSGSCWASTSAGTVCGGGATPMRVCAPGGLDPEGNDCNWEGCGLGQGSTVDRYFGGCAGNTTAGTLCCKD